jgi:HAE1 family hydrophobic/amphiphilic exporter-1
MLEYLFRNRVGVILIFVLSAAAGIVLVGRLPIQLYPRTNRPTMSVSFRHDGYSATGFSTEYGQSIESRLMAVEGLDLLEARYGNNQSSFTLTFDWKIDALEARADVESALTGINALLPSEFQSSSRVRFSTGENAGYLMIGVSSPTVSSEDLYKLLIANVEPKLLQVKDVDAIEIFSVEDIRARVTLDQDEMLKYGLTINDVNNAMRLRTAPQSIGRLRDTSTTMSVNYSRPAIGLFELGDLPILEQENFTVTLEDIADIEIFYTIPSATFVIEGVRGVQLVATPINGGNIRSMSEEVTAVLEHARGTGELPADTEISLLLDPAEYINDSIGSVVQAALLGAALAMAVIVFSLAEVRNTILIGISIPVSLVLSFILMYAFDISLNLISLGGMALAVGMIVDASIVVMENIHRLRVEHSDDGDPMRLRGIIIEAVDQVRSPIIASTLTTILVFLPLSFTAPLTNAILGDQAKVVVFALTFSLVVSLTLVPLLAYLVFRRRGKAGRTDGRERFTPYTGLEPVAGMPEHPFAHPKRMILAGMEAMVRAYERAIRAVVSRKAGSIAVIAVSAAALAVSVAVLLPGIPREIITPPSSDRLIVFMQSVGDVTSQEIVEQKFPEMDKLIRESLGQYIANTYAEVRGRMNRIFVVLKDTRYASHVTAELQRLFPSDNDWYYSIMGWDPAQLPLPRTNDLQLSVSGPDAAENVALLERLRDTVSGTGLYAWVSTVPTTSFAEELTLTPRPGVMNRVPGYGESALLGLIQRALTGTQSIRFEHDGRSVSVSASYPDSLIRGRLAFENFLLPYRQSAIPLKHFFEFAHSTTVSQIASENGEPVYRLYAVMPRGRGASDRGAFERQVRGIIENEFELPPGTAVTVDNPQEELDDSIRSLFISLGVSVALIYLLLAFQFNSLTVPLVILVTVPLGLIGLVVSLFVFRSTLSLNSMLGAILLSGIVVNNAIILIEFYFELRGQLEDRLEALVTAARIRFRPIYMTSLTTIVGMLPLAIGLGEGSNVVKPLGIAVSGGLVVSTVLTLFVVPAILSLTRLNRRE